MTELGVQVTTITSDTQFNTVAGAAYDYIILDPWTWAGPGFKNRVLTYQFWFNFSLEGWIPKPNIRNHLDKLFILDFFGSKSMKGNLKIPQTRMLSAYGSPWSTYLGYYTTDSGRYNITKKKRGVIWGKDPKHFKDRKALLTQISSYVPLASTAREKVYDIPGIQWLGHQTRNSWIQLLRESSFLLGLGDPLLGPSAIEAVVSGTMFINPIYEAPVRDIFFTQHDFAEREIGYPYVCSVKLTNSTGIKDCIDYALNHVMEPFVPPSLTKSAYMDRVRAIFGL